MIITTWKGKGTVSKTFENNHHSKNIIPKHYNSDDVGLRRDLEGAQNLYFGGFQCSLFSNL